MFSLILPLMLLLLSAPADSLEPGWVVSIATLENEEAAAELTVELNELFGDLIDYLYIPDWESLSGSSGWLVYAGPFDDPDQASSWGCEFLYRFPDVHLIWLGHQESRQTLRARPRCFGDLAGIMPPWPDYYAGESVERIQLNEQEDPPCECMIPQLYRLSIPGWEMTGVLDSFIGMVEERAYRTGVYDPVARYEWASSFLREHAADQGLEIYEDPGVITLVHQLPDPQLRESDADIWVALRNDSLEYGSRIRLFHGLYRETWHHIPEEWHDSFEPDIVTTPEEAIEFLMTVLVWSGAYTEGQLENISFSVEWLDNLNEEDYRDYFDIAIREVHRPGGEGDPATAPVIDRFRVYERGEVIWFAMPRGIFVPLEERF